MPEDEKEGRSGSGVVAVLVAVTALITVAAGAYVVANRGDHPSAAPKATLPEWRREAARVCSGARRRAAEINQASGRRAPDTAAATRLLQQLGELARSFRDEIGAIPAPPAHEPDIQALTAILDLEVTNFDDAARAAENRDEASFEQAVARGERLDNREATVWATLDARGCATTARALWH